MGKILLGLYESYSSGVKGHIAPFSKLFYSGEHVSSRSLPSTFFSDLVGYGIPNYSFS